MVSFGTPVAQCSVWVVHASGVGFCIRYKVRYIDRATVLLTTSVLRTIPYVVQFSSQAHVWIRDTPGVTWTHSRLTMILFSAATKSDFVQIVPQTAACSDGNIFVIIYYILRSKATHSAKQRLGSVLWSLVQIGAYSMRQRHDKRGVYFSLDVGQTCRVQFT